MHMLTAFLFAFSLVLSPVWVAGQPYQGYIASPANGTAISPGQTFTFSYITRADYCVSSFNYSVWLLTDTPRTNDPFALNAVGYFFGRYASSTDHHDGPGTLVMPDFSQYHGFATGKSVSNAPVHIAVVEEWGTCTPTFGFNLTVTSNNLIYNKTKTH